MNLQVLTLLNQSMDTLGTGEGVVIKSESLIKFRNYFFQKVLGSQSINDLNTAIKGLVKLNDYPFVHKEGTGVINMGDSKASVKFEFVDMLGSPYKSIKNVKVSLKSEQN